MLIASGRRWKARRSGSGGRVNFQPLSPWQNLRTMNALSFRIRAAFVGLAVLLLAGCAANKLQSHQANPDYVGKHFHSVLVHAVAYDRTLQRVFEDRMVARLGGRGIKGVPAYSLFDKPGEIEEAVLREAIARAGVDGVMVTRLAADEQATTVVSGGTVVTGTGMVGMYGYYSGVWQVTEIAPDTIEGATWMNSSTRLFDAKTGTPVWAGNVKTASDGDPAPAMQKYIDLVFGAMVKDGVL
jgi:hypothetical protein